MAVLLDTGILLRVQNRGDPLHQRTRAAVRKITDRGEQAVTTLQNVSEFWNVCTRPVSARGGLGMRFEEAEFRLRVIERIVTVLPEPPGLYGRWRQIVMAHRVQGVQVHDAKLVAAMSIHGITELLTLNADDFRRFPGISIVNVD